MQEASHHFIVEKQEGDKVTLRLHQQVIDELKDVVNIELPKVGDEVDECLLTAESTKALFEIPSPYKGVVSHIEGGDNHDLATLRITLRITRTV